ncbi:MAG: Spy/CpxP family protein refolding chaperone [Rubrivivax sp.]|nr:Spy/CpxP family protein refolding chaperone [Rubrivivax sp.]
MRNAPERNTRIARRLMLGTAALTLVASFLQPVAAQPAGPGFGAGGYGPHAGMMGRGDMAGGMGMMQGRGMGMTHGGGMGMMHGRGGERMLDGVGATAEQKTQVRQIMDTARNELKPLREAGQALRRQLGSLFAQPTVDARAVEALRQQMQANHEQASKRMTQAMLDASRVLTPEQRKQMAERMEQRRGMMQRHRAERETLDGPARRP